MLKVGCQVKQVGWQVKQVMALFEESPTEVLLTVKKRPRHTKVYGQIYMKPYRLPSKKRATQNSFARWADNLPSPRPELLTIPHFELPIA
ncbi:identical protein binding, partial [Homalodisca vitripennis]